MTSLNKNARTAGLIYLLLVLTGPLRLIYIPTTLFVSGDATTTATNILANETLFRLGIASSLVSAVLLVYLTFALYRLFREVDPTQAALVVVLGGVLPSALTFVNVVNDAAALILLRGADFLNVFDKPQRDALAFLALRLHHQMDVASEVLWGLWLFPLALLTWRSHFLPRFLSVWLILAGVSYLAVSITAEVLPAYEDMVFNVGSLPRLGELAFALWILIVGAKDRPRGIR